MVEVNGDETSQRDHNTAYTECTIYIYMYVHYHVLNVGHPCVFHLLLASMPNTQNPMYNHVHVYIQSQCMRILKKLCYCTYNSIRSTRTLPYVDTVYVQSLTSISLLVEDFRFFTKYGG